MLRCKPNLPVLYGLYPAFLAGMQFDYATSWLATAREHKKDGSDFTFAVKCARDHWHDYLSYLRQARVECKKYN